jgi:PPM family protein phosphatase
LKRVTTNNKNSARALLITNTRARGAYMAILFEAAGKTDIGRVRKRNEDQFLIADLRKDLHIVQTSLAGPHLGWTSGTTGHLLVVADGVGGLAGGELASGLALETISWYVAKTMPWFFRYQDGREKELEAELVRAVEACQQSVADVAAESPNQQMGTTLTMAYVLWPRAYVVHAGDSRCYLHRDHRLVRITRDHTIAQRALDEGVLTEEEAQSSGLVNTLWKCIGAGGEGVSPDVYHATLRPGDELLLCTDGLTRKLPEERISDLLTRSTSPERAVEVLIAAANEAGGEDNITAIVGRLLPLAQTDGTLPEPVAVPATT